jgi:hypothetical protein
MVRVDTEEAGVPVPPGARAPLLNIDADIPYAANQAEGLPMVLFNVVQAQRVLYSIGEDAAGASPAWGNIPRYYMALVESLRGARGETSFV